MQQIYIHGEGVRDFKLVTLPKESKKSEVIAALQSVNAFSDEEKVYLFIDDDEEPLDSKGKQLSFKHKQHVHVHQCRKVQVTIVYNGQQTLLVTPNTKIDKLLRLAASAFSITEDDAADMIIKFGNETLESTARIGSYVPAGTCSVSLSLTPNQQVKG